MRPSVISSILVFALIMIIFVIYDRLTNRNKIMHRLNRTYQNIEDELPKETLINKLKTDISKAQLNVDYRLFIVFSVSLGIVSYLISLTLFKNPAIALAPGVAMGYLIPFMYLKSKKDKIEKQFNKELIQVLRRMSATTRNGSILQALNEVVQLKTISKKTRLCFKKILHKVRFNDTIEDAFDEIAREIGNENLILASIGISINKKLGASISKNFDDIAQNIQKKQMQEKEQNSIMAQTRATVVILSCLPFLILGYMFITAPYYFEDYLKSFINQIVFFGLIGFMVFGCIFLLSSTKKQ
ncbi:MAG: type II secretion system F family protein [Candidatus Woesearchaeota archaeon]